MDGKCGHVDCDGEDDEESDAGEPMVDVGFEWHFNRGNIGRIRSISCCCCGSAE